MLHLVHALRATGEGFGLSAMCGRGGIATVTVVETAGWSDRVAFITSLPKEQGMKVGVPKEVKNREYRVALTPIGVHELVQHGHEVVVQKTAGEGSQIPDELYVAAGATMLDTAQDVWARPT